jgi:hypothetical protein
VQGSALQVVLAFFFHREVQKGNQDIGQAWQQFIYPSIFFVIFLFDFLIFLVIHFIL